MISASHYTPAVKEQLQADKQWVASRVLDCKVVVLLLLVLVLGVVPLL